MKSKHGYITVFNFNQKAFKIYKELDEVFVEPICELKTDKTIFNIHDVCEFITKAIDSILDHIEEKFLATKEA